MNLTITYSISDLEYKLLIKILPMRAVVVAQVLFPEWLVLEQVFIAALDVGDTALARVSCTI